MSRMPVTCCTGDPLCCSRHQQMAEIRLESKATIGDRNPTCSPPLARISSATIGAMLPPSHPLPPTPNWLPRQQQWFSPADGPTAIQQPWDPGLCRPARRQQPPAPPPSPRPPVPPFHRHLLAQCLINPGTGGRAASMPIYAYYAYICLYMPACQMCPTMSSSDLQQAKAGLCCCAHPVQCSLNQHSAVTRCSCKQDVYKQGTGKLNLTTGCMCTDRTAASQNCICKIGRLTGFNDSKLSCHAGGALRGALWFILDSLHAPTTAGEVVCLTYT